MFNVLVSSPRANTTSEDSPVLAQLEISGSLNFGNVLEVSQQTDLDCFVFVKHGLSTTPPRACQSTKTKRQVFRC